MRRQHIERTILFLGEDNACLSEIAEATARHLAATTGAARRSRPELR